MPRSKLIDLRRTSALVMLVSAVAIIVAACGGTGAGEQSDPSVLTFEDAMAIGWQLTNDGTFEARQKDGFVTFLRGPRILGVGQTGVFDMQVKNASFQYKPEAPYEINQTSGEFLTSGPITLNPLEGFRDMRGPQKLAAGSSNGSAFEVTCDAAGPATVTFNSKGTSEINAPGSASYTLTVDFSLVCVPLADLETPTPFPSATSGAISTVDPTTGVSQNTPTPQPSPIQAPTAAAGSEPDFVIEVLVFGGRHYPVSQIALSTFQGPAEACAVDHWHVIVGHPAVSFENVTDPLFGPDPDHLACGLGSYEDFPIIEFGVTREHLEAFCESHKILVPGRSTQARRDCDDHLLYGR